MKRGLILLSAAFILFSCKNEDKETTTTRDSLDAQNDTTTVHQPPAMNDTMPMAMVSRASATLSGTYEDTTVMGEAIFEMDTAMAKVSMVLNLTIPAKAGKSVAVHIHEHGDCGEKGNLAHGHWNPTGSAHGKWGSGNFHSGDIGNVKLDKNGKGSMKISTDRWSLGGTSGKNILKKALIVHGGVDDYTTQPTGNAGTRIGCGVIN